MNLNDFSGRLLRRIIGKRMAGALAAVLLSSTLTGCGFAAGDGTGYCTVKANNVHESTGSPGWMDAKMQISCNVALERVSGTIKLQRRVSGVWHDVPYTIKSRVYENTKPNTNYVVQTADYACHRGVFRSAGRGYGVLNGQPSASGAWKYGNAVTNPCG